MREGIEFLHGEKKKNHQNEPFERNGSQDGRDPLENVLKNRHLTKLLPLRQLVNQV
jgi:hypothetical protein